MISAKVTWKLLTKTARVLFVNHSGWCFMFWKSELYKAKLPANSADALLVPRCRVCHGEDCFVLGAAYYELGINAYFLAALESPIDVKIRLRLYLPSSGYFDIISSCPKSDKKPPVLKFNSNPWPNRPVLPFCPFWLHTFICLNSPELHCWLSSHPHCIKMLGLCFRVYVRRSQGAETDPAKDSMPRACRRGQGLPSDLPKDSLCLHLVVIDCKFVVRKVFGMTLPKTACPGHALRKFCIATASSKLPFSVETAGG